MHPDGMSSISHTPNYLPDIPDSPSGSSLIFRWHGSLKPSDSLALSAIATSSDVWLIPLWPIQDLDSGNSVLENKICPFAVWIRSSQGLCASSNKKRNSRARNSSVIFMINSYDRAGVSGEKAFG